MPPVEAARWFLAPREFLESPDAPVGRCSVPQAEAYTRWLATHHYENFHVVSFLLPKHLHQDFYNVYSFCRWADDLGDEMGETERSLQLLSWWRGELEAMYCNGRVEHPVYVALQGTAVRHNLPITPFADLITAFEQDQTVTRYANWEELFHYCKYSANPVGRLVLYLCGYSDEQRQLLSDATCTALQLANFWQDVIVDLECICRWTCWRGTATRWNNWRGGSLRRGSVPRWKKPSRRRGDCFIRAGRWPARSIAAYRWTSSCSRAEV